jgi:hypothetical protein
MNYETYQPCNELRSLVKCYWTLEISAAENSEKQRIIPDGCIEMAFILADDIKRFTSTDQYILQPRAMIIGQIVDPFYIQPTGEVKTFAVRFYPFGFANFVDDLNKLANKETPLTEVFGKSLATDLEEKIISASSTQQRIEVVETFLLSKLSDESTIDNLVRTTVDVLLASKGTSPIYAVVDGDHSKRRQIERKFRKQIGISPKQFCRVIRLQTALKMLLHQTTDTLTHIAYESEYYDQAHFIKDFKEFTGTNPKDFLQDSQMALSSIFYRSE